MRVRRGRRVWRRNNGGMPLALEPSIAGASEAHEVNANAPSGAIAGTQETAPATKVAGAGRCPPEPSARRTRRDADLRPQAFEGMGVLAGQFAEGGRNLSASAHGELRPQDVRVSLGSAWRDSEPPGDLRVRESVRDQLDDLALPGREADLAGVGEHAAMVATRRLRANWPSGVSLGLDRRI